MHRYLLWIAAILAIPLHCFAQDDPVFHSCTLNIAGGWTPRTPQDEEGLDAGWNFQAGGGFALTHRPSTARKWTAFLTGNFVFDKMRVSPAALAAAKELNPTDIGLLEANSAKTKFYGTTLDPTIRFPEYKSLKGVSFYVFAGFGWLRRSVEFSGAAGEGTLLQPGSPAVFGASANSAAYDAGFGISYRIARTVTVYVEGRRLHGLAVNNTTTLLPLAAGLRW
jgi:hypothetical protein